MIEICYSKNGEIDVSGYWKELEQLRQQVLTFTKSNLKEVFIETNENIIQSPWDFAAKGLKIVRCGDAVRISISKDNVLLIEGSDENLEGFASFLYFDKNASSGFHSHYEYYDGNKWIEPDSIPLIISLKTVS